MTTSLPTPSATPSPPPSRFTARNQEDLLAVVPVVLGFVPSDSAVMLTFGSAGAFHARVDLPPPDAGPADLAAMVESLRAPARRHGVPRVVFVLYSGDERAADRVGHWLVRAFRAASIDVVDVIRSDGLRWYPLLRGRRSWPASGVPYDLSTHRFAAQAVLDGRVTLASRAELRDSLAPEPHRVDRVAAALERLEELESPDWVRATTGRLASAREVPDDELAARLLLAVGGDPGARDAAWDRITRREARGHVELWTDLLRRAPDELVGSAAAVLALSAWLAGNGALAWCAVDRAEVAAPGHTLARLVGELLADAVSPEAWEEASSMRNRT